MLQKSNKKRWRLTKRQCSNSQWQPTLTQGCAIPYSIIFPYLATCGTVLFMKLACVIAYLSRRYWPEVIGCHVGTVPGGQHAGSCNGSIIVSKLGSMKNAVEYLSTPLRVNTCRTNDTPALHQNAENECSGLDDSKLTINWRYKPHRYCCYVDTGGK